MFDAHIICRFSSQDKEDASIERQKVQCLEVARKLGCNAKNIKVIANDNLSGASPWNKRTDLLELESDIKNGLCKQVIVYRFDRLARDFEVSGKLLNLLKEHNIRLHDEGGNLDYLTAAGEAFFGMKSVFASFERRMITDRMYAGKLYKFKHGTGWGGPLPLGLKREGKKVVEDPAGMNVVNKMFRLVMSGTSISQIEKWTSENGINRNKPRKAGGICDWSIKSILTNRLYVTGQYEVKTRKEGMLFQTISLANPVPSQLFDEVQGILKSRSPGRPMKGTYLLGGLAYPLLPIGEDLETDENTGDIISNGELWGINPKIRFRAMSKNSVPCYYCRQWGDVRRKEGVYLMSNGRRHKKRFAIIPREVLENAVWNALEKMAESPSSIIESMRTESAVMKADKHVLHDLMESKKQKIMQLELSLERFYNMFGLTGDQDDFRKIQSTKQDLKAAREELSGIQARYDTVSVTLENSLHITDSDSLALIKNLRETGSPEAKLAFFQRYISRVTIDPAGNIEILGRFEVLPGTPGVFGHWAKGRLLCDSLTSNNSGVALSSQVVP